MKRRFIQWCLCSGVIALVSLIGLFINDGQLVFSIYEPLLRPWGALCRAITPDSWQTMGNILLGLAWMGSGILVYSALFGVIATLLLSLIEGRRDRDAPKRTAPYSGSWWPFCLGALGIAIVTTILLILSATEPIVPKEPAGKGMPKLEGIGDDMFSNLGVEGPSQSTPAKIDFQDRSQSEIEADAERWDEFLRTKFDPAKNLSILTKPPKTQK